MSRPTAPSSSRPLSNERTVSTFTSQSTPSVRAHAPLPSLLQIAITKVDDGVAEKTNVAPRARPHTLEVRGHVDDTACVFLSFPPPSRASPPRTVSPSPSHPPPLDVDVFGDHGDAVKTAPGAYSVRTTITPPPPRARETSPLPTPVLRRHRVNEPPGSHDDGSEKDEGAGDGDGDETDEWRDIEGDVVPGMGKDGAQKPGRKDDVDIHQPRLSPPPFPALSFGVLDTTEEQLSVVHQRLARSASLSEWTNAVHQPYSRRSISLCALPSAPPCSRPLSIEPQRRAPTITPLPRRA